MPKGKRPAHASWLFRDKPAVAHAIDLYDAYDRFGLMIRYDESAAQGSLAIQFAVQLEGGRPTQHLSLAIRPEMIEAISCDTLLQLPRAVLDLVPDTSTTNAADVLAISLTLRSPGRVICPLIALPIQPQQPDQHQFAAFSRLAQAKNIRIYLGRNQVLPDQRARLQRFVTDLGQGRLRAPHVDLRWLRGGQGAQEADWCNIHPPSALPPNYGESCNPRKRPRAASSTPLPEETFIKRFFENIPLPGSPTEVNTPSTDRHTPTPSTKSNPMSKTHSTKSNTTTNPANTLASRGNVTSCRANTPSTRGSTASREDTPLPEYQDTHGLHDAQYSVSPRARFPCGKSSSADIKPSIFCSGNDRKTFPQAEMVSGLSVILGQMLPKIIESVFESTLGPLIDARLEDLVNRKLEVLVDKKLPVLIDDALEQNMDKFLSNLEDDNSRAEAEFSETADVAKIEIHETRDSGVKEIERFVQEKLADFDHDAETIVTNAIDTLEDRTTELKQQLDDHRRPKVRRRNKTQHLKNMTRRNSV